MKKFLSLCVAWSLILASVAMAVLLLNQMGLGYDRVVELPVNWERPFLWTVFCVAVSAVQFFGIFYFWAAVFERANTVFPAMFLNSFWAAPVLMVFGARLANLLGLKEAATFMFEQRLRVLFVVIGLAALALLVMWIHDNLPHWAQEYLDSWRRRRQLSGDPRTNPHG